MKESKRFKAIETITSFLPFIKPKRKFTYPSQCSSINGKGQIVDDDTGKVLDCSGQYPLYGKDRSTLCDDTLDRIHQRRLDFLKEVDQAIKDYFMFKYGTDLDDIERIKNNVNNFKLHSRFQKVVSLSSGQENYYDGEFLFLTVVDHPLQDKLIIRHWLRG